MDTRLTLRAFDIELNAGLCDPQCNRRRAGWLLNLACLDFFPFRSNDTLQQNLRCSLVPTLCFLRECLQDADIPRCNKLLTLRQGSLDFELHRVRGDTKFPLGQTGRGGG